MKVNSLNQFKLSYKNYYSQNNNQSSPIANFNTSPKIITGQNFQYYQNNNLIHVISFGKTSFSPEKYEQIPSLKMKVAGVSHFQDAIREVSDSDARRNPQINFELIPEKKEIRLIYQKTGKQIGYIHHEILEHLYDDIAQNPEDYKLELAGVMRDPKFSNQGLRVRLNYAGKDTTKTKEVFEKITETPSCIRITYPYQKAESPQSILNLILNFNEQLHGESAKRETQQIVDNIAQVITDPKNKTFLLWGHKDPDGDDVGSMLGMKNAITLTGADKKVDCAIDDRIPNLFRYLSDINSIKHPKKAEIVKTLSAEIKEKQSSGAIEEASILEKIRDYFAQTTKSLQKNKIYDVVILMDVSTPDRAGFNIASHIGPNTKVIIIDHHMKNLEAWTKAKARSGIDIEKVQRDKLMWVEDRVPAATEQVAVIAGKINPRLNDAKAKYSRKEMNIVKRLAAAILTGLQTDTSGYSRSANLLAEDMKLPAHQRPAYRPIGLAKWFSLITDRKITRNLIESGMDNREGKLRTIKPLTDSFVAQHAFRNDELQLNYAIVEKSEIDKLWLEAAKTLPEVTQKDILGKIKYSTAFKRLKKLLNNPRGSDDIITYLMSQTSAKGKLDVNGKKSTENMVSFSFRSKSGTNHASLLANLLNGGGHGAAAGGRIAGENVDLKTKVNVIIDGKVETDTAKILETLRQNYAIDHGEEVATGAVKKQIGTIPAAIAESGKNINELIADVVREIRKSQILERAAKETLSIVA